MARMNNVNVMSELEILNAALAVGWVKFSYRKADGTKRIAIGTTNTALCELALGRRLRGINESFYRNGGYFDLVRGEWRKFNRERFIGLELDRMSNEQAIRDAIVMAFSFDDVELPLLHAIGVNLIGAPAIVKCIDDVQHLSAPCMFDGMCKYEYVCDMFVEREKTKSVDRDALKAELLRLRKREDEILKILLAD